MKKVSNLSYIYIQVVKNKENNIEFWKKVFIKLVSSSKDNKTKND